MKMTYFILAVLAIQISCIFCKTVQQQGENRGDRPSQNQEGPPQLQDQGQGQAGRRPSGQEGSEQKGRPEIEGQVQLLGQRKRRGSNQHPSSSGGDRQQTPGVQSDKRKPPRPEGQGRPGQQRPEGEQKPEIQHLDGTERPKGPEGEHGQTKTPPPEGGNGRTPSLRPQGENSQTPPPPTAKNGQTPLPPTMG